jgi:MFS family permease
VAVKLMNVKEFDVTALPLYFGAAVSLVGAVVALFLPATPPPAKGQKASVMDSLGLRSLTLMKDSNFAVFIIVSLLVMIPFGIYWSYFSMYLDSMGYKMLTFTQNLGQAAEMVFMLLVTVALKKIGVKKAMLAGLVCLLVRYVSFFLSGMSPDLAWLVYIGILVHGIIYGFFFVGGQIYINRVAPKEMQAQAQGFIFLVTFGVGLLVANFANEALIGYFTANKVVNWSGVWAVTTVFSAILLGVFSLFFRYDESKGVTPISLETQSN